jgi:hypothetical protein
VAIIDPSIAARIRLLSNIFGCSILAPKPTLASEPPLPLNPLGASHKLRYDNAEALWTSTWSYRSS